MNTDSLSINSFLSITENKVDYKSILNKIKDEIDNILKDDIIDLHDLPQIILLISDIYNNHIFENTIENIGIPNIVQFTLDSIIDSPILPLPDIEKSIIKKIIDSSLQLLKFKSDIIKTTECCFNIKWISLFI